MKNFNMIPSDFPFRQELPDLMRIALAIREGASNGRNYGASELNTLAFHHDGEDWLAIMHDGRPPEDLRDILENGCSPHRSGGEGGAFAGCGLVATAHSLSPEPTLIFASHTLNEKFKVGKYYTVPKVNQFYKSHVTEQWTQILEKYLGPSLVKKYKVFYIFRMRLQDLKKEDTRTVLPPRLFATLAYLMPEPGLKIFYCEKQLGYPYRDAAERNRYRSFEALAHQDTKSGSSKRRAPTMEGQVQRYCQTMLNKHGEAMLDENGNEILARFIIPCDPFDLEFRSHHQTVRVKRASVHLMLFPGRKVGKSTKNRIITEREVHDENGKNKKGSDTERGYPPTMKGFLTVPWFYEKMRKEYGEEAANQYIRFDDNPLGTYSKPGKLMNALGLPYCIGNAYPVISVQIQEIESVIDNIRDNVVEAAEPHRVMSLFGRRADFTFSNTDAVHMAMNLACEAAKDHVAKEIHDICARLFDYNPEGFLQFNLDGELAEVTKKNRKLGNVKSVDIYDMGNGGKKFDGEIAAGTAVRLAFFHKGLQEWLSNVEVHKHSTRGVEVQRIEGKQLKQFPEVKKAVEALQNGDSKLSIPVFSVIVEELSRREEDGSLTPITAEDYKFSADYLPSRNIVLDHDGERITLICPDVPVCHRERGNVGSKLGIKLEKVPTKGNRPKATRLTFSDDPEVWFQFDEPTAILRFNENTPWVRQHFINRPNIQEGNALFKNLETLYLSLRSQAITLMGQLSKWGIVASGGVAFPEYYGDIQDCLLNESLKDQIRNNPALRSIIEKIDREIGEDEDRQEELMAG